MATKNKPQEVPKQEDKSVAPVMPDYMKAFMQSAQGDTGSMVSSSVSIPRLSYRGKRWRFIVDGEEDLVKELAVQVIVVGVEPDAGRFIKTYYEKEYVSGDTEPPTCSSSDGIFPDAWVTLAQSPRCQGCPKNVFGSATSRSGGKAKACHDSKRLWVVRPDDLDIVYGLNVPIMSLKNLAEYGKYCARNNFPSALLITELSMDDEAEFPKLCFKHVGFVAQDDVQTVIDLNTRRPWRTTVSSGPAMVIDNGGGTAQPKPLPPPPTPKQQPERKANGAGINEIIGDWQKPE